MSCKAEGRSNSAVFGNTVSGGEAWFLDFINGGVSHEELLSGCDGSNILATDQSSVLLGLFQGFLLSSAKLAGFAGAYNVRWEGLFVKIGPLVLLVEHFGLWFVLVVVLKFYNLSNYLAIYIVNKMAKSTLPLASMFYYFLK